MIVHLSGKLIPASEAAVSPFDRGFIFGDGVYEGLRAVSTPRGGGGPRIVGLDLHVARMRQGLESAGIPWDAERLGPLSTNLLRANNLTDAFVYWQVTRGVPNPGDPVRSRVPASKLTPTIFGYCSPQPPLESCTSPLARTAIVCEDPRWTLGRLKSISLMGNVVCSMRAAAAGADDAVFVRAGLLAEGLATNVVIAATGPSGETSIATPSLDSVPLLAGVTRAILLKACPEIAERPVRAEELAHASEIMLIGSTTMVAAIVRLDGRPVGTGAPGPAAARLLRALVEAIRAGA